jgi:hypothetical protein
MRPLIPRLNFQHLLYFWCVVRTKAGSDPACS